MDAQKCGLAANQAVLASLSQELRTYMNAIVSFSLMMKEDLYNSSEKEEFSNHIYSSCGHLLQLFGGFLDSARLETAGSKPELRLFGLNYLLDDLTGEFREMIEKEGKTEIELVKDIRTDTRQKVLADKVILSRIITSLFRNSLMNTSSGQIKIGLYQEGKMLTFYVRDTGSGYEKFREFLKSENISESLAIHNDIFTAVNLILARKLVSIVGGSIWIEKNGTEGSTICFSLPAAIIPENHSNIPHDLAYSTILI